MLIPLLTHITVLEMYRVFDEFFEYFVKSYTEFVKNACEMLEYIFHCKFVHLTYDTFYNIFSFYIPFNVDSDKRSKIKAGSSVKFLEFNVDIN